jgi:hypothetical protein
VPAQVVLQHRLSTHIPDEHSLPVVHTCPCLLTHAPSPLQVTPPVHVSLSSAFATVEQVPVEQLMQAPAQLELQQWPSTQRPLAHSPAAAHVCACFLRHVPAVPQVVALVQVSSSALITVEQVPGVLAHVWQLPLQAMLQQTPSTHRLDPHSAATAHEAPIALVAIHTEAAQ